MEQNNKGSAEKNYLDTFVYSSSARFYRHYGRNAWRFRWEGYLSDKPNFDEVYAFYVEWCATIGVSADDKRLFGMVVSHYNADKHRQDIELIERLDAESLKGKSRHGNSKNQKILNKFLGKQKQI